MKILKTLNKLWLSDPFRFFACLALVVTLLAVVACLASALQPPMASYVVTSPFGYRLPPLPGAAGGGGESLHDGVDFKGPSGSRILAASDGVIRIHYPPPGTPVPGRPPGTVFAGHPVMGGYIEIDHGGGIVTKYGHMRATFVHTNQYVRAGQVIGVQGATGMATGEHLHFAVAINPLLLFSQSQLIMSLAEWRSLLK